MSPFAEFTCTLEGQTFLPLVRTLRLDGCADHNNLLYISRRISLCAFRRLLVLFNNLQCVQIHNMSITCCAAPTHHPCLELMKMHPIRQLEFASVTCDPKLQTQIPLLTRLVPVDTLFLSSVDLQIFSTMGTNTINVANCVMRYLDTRSSQFGQLVDAIAPTISSFTFRSVYPRDIYNISPFIAKLSPSLTSLSIEICMYQFCECHLWDLFKVCSIIRITNQCSHLRSPQ